MGLGERSGCGISILVLALLAGCNQDGSADLDGAEGSGVPTSSHGTTVGSGDAPCAEGLGCAAGEFCDEGDCQACGTGVPAPGKFCYGEPTVVAERGGTLKVAHLRGGDGVLVDNNEVHVRVLFRDGEGSLREQWFGTSAERLHGELRDLYGDGFDEFTYCNAHSTGCRVGTLESDAVVTIASVSSNAHELAVVPPHGDFPGRIFGANYQRDRWDSWLLYPDGVVSAAPLPVFPTGPLVSGDLDGDGVSELAAPVDDGLVVLALGVTGIRYDEVASAPVPFDTTFLAAVDLDNDLRAEVLLGTPDAQLLIARLTPSGDIVFDDPLQLAEQPREIAIGDLDGDGRLDLAYKDASEPPPPDEQPTFDRIQVLAQTQSGAFERFYVSYGGRVGSIAIFDVDLDGHNDLVLNGRGGIIQLLANP